MLVVQEFKFIFQSIHQPLHCDHTHSISTSDSPLSLSLSLSLSITHTLTHTRTPAHPQHKTLTLPHAHTHTDKLSLSVIYVIECSQCDIRYVGEITQKLEDRINQHQYRTGQTSGNPLHATVPINPEPQSYPNGTN